MLSLYNPCEGRQQLQALCCALYTICYALQPTQLSAHYPIQFAVMLVQRLCKSHFPDCLSAELLLGSAIEGNKKGLKSVWREEGS